MCCIRYKVSIILVVGLFCDRKIAKFNSSPNFPSIWYACFNLLTILFFVCVFVFH